MFIKTNIAAALGAALLIGGTHLALAAGTSSTTTTATPQQPLSQALTSVDKNLDKNLDNPGLRNAKERLERNQARIEKTEKLGS